MDDTPNLRLPYIAAAQAQKHVTHNEAIRALDALVHLAVADKDLGQPPASPANGVRYIVGPSASGAWAGHTREVAAFQDGAWMFHAPREGWLAWVADEDRIYAWDGAAWVLAGGGSASINPTPLVGVNATADSTNRLSVASPASLFNHEGAGHQLKINKAAAAQTASLLFQDAFSGRAEVGLTGDDDLHVKVSADGAIWREALVVDRATGAVAFPNTAFGAAGGGANPSLAVNGDFQLNQRGFAGGALAAGSYGHDRWKADTGGASYTVAGMTVTLASGTLVQVVESALWRVASLALTPVTVSVEAPSADLTVTLGSASGTITSGSGRRSVTLTPGAGDTGNLSLKLVKATAGSVTFGRLKAETGSSATAWQPRPAAQELALAQRYFYRIAGSNFRVHKLGFCWSSTVFSVLFEHPVAMRATATVSVPTPTSFIIQNGGAGIYAPALSSAVNSGVAAAVTCAAWFFTVASGLVAGYGAFLSGNGSTDNLIDFSAEL